jgi:alkylation response protein AidB-like acyl-CoA dehydrogenase
MRFGASSDQLSFAESIDGFLTASDPAGVARRWAAGDRNPGLALWSRLAELGLPALRIPEASGGLGASALDLVVAFERLGYHGIVGPWVETAAVAPGLLSGLGDPEQVLKGIADGTARVTLSAPPLVKYALDVSAATHTYLIDGARVSRAEPERALRSVDPTRHLTVLRVTETIGLIDPALLGAALDAGALACAAQLLGLGKRMLAEAITYATSRRQFGRAIGENQAVKHRLADVRVALDFVAPLVHHAALALDASGPDAPRDVSAAKVSASDAAMLAARSALQVHGAIGYTSEHDLSLWFTKTRALVGAWGTASQHRGRVMTSIAGT